MNRILLVIILLSTSCVEMPKSDNLAPSSIFSGIPSAPTPESDDNNLIVFHKISKGALYFGVGIAFRILSLFSRLGWKICLISPWDTTVGNECLLLSRLCDSIAQRSFAQIFENPSSSSLLLEKVPPSQSSWLLNQVHLSQIPAFSNEEKQLLLFLERRWLAKSTGFYSFVIDWICPSFGIPIQVHPEATNSYARDPSNKISLTYKNRVENWKQTLPHPQYFPLILTRPSNLYDYLPSYIAVPQCEDIKITAEKLALKIRTADSKSVVDLTHIFPDNLTDPKTWLKTWNTYQASFSQVCKKHHLDPNQILCIQRVQQKEIGGIRLLPLDALSAKEIDLQHQFLLEWISKFGLSANRVELDRSDLPSNTSMQGHNAPPIPTKFQSKEEFVSYLNFFDQSWRSDYPQKNLMLKGTLQVLKGLFANLSEDKWDEIIHSPTRSSIAQLSFLRIQEQLKLLEQKKDEAFFFNTASHLEQIHASLAALLEIFAPFTPDNFPTIYRNLLTSIPQNLKPLTSYGIFSSGMMSLTGVFKAVEKTVGKSPRVLYGENTYFENILTANRVSNASPISEATEEAWREVDLILAQFNPALKRIDLQTTEYKVENIVEILHKCLDTRREKSLTLALDCTLDYIDSPRVSRLLAEFQDEIERGTLNIICYRSGLKFDLFGMDNYCGAPFYIIHNQDAKWAAFDSLLTDPVLQTDRLSLNWFCLAYQNAASQLGLYQKQIFDNTRALLHKVPSRLFHNKNAKYRIIPIEEGADPAFIDIKIFGPLHQIRGALVGGLLSLKCMEEKQPIFYRPSLGFYHPNCSILFSKECSTIRLTLGLDPTQIDLFVECFEEIDALNDSSWQALSHKFRQNIPHLLFIF